MTVTVQVPAAAIVPPEKETDDAAATGANVGVPQPLVAAVGTAATFIAAGEIGKVSVKATPLTALFWLGLVMLKVRVEVPPAKIGFGENSLLMRGGMTAVSEALAIPEAPALFVPVVVEVTNPLMLLCGPAVVAVTVAVTVQFAPAASVPPVNESVLGAVRVNVPAHCTDDPEVTVSPAGKVSVKATPLTATLALGLVTVKVSVDVAPTATVLGAKLLVMVGGFGMAQPVKMMVSRYIGLVRSFAPTALILKVVVLVPVVVAVVAGIVCHAPFGNSALYIVLNAPPFALE